VGSRSAPSAPFGCRSGTCSITCPKAPKANDVPHGVGPYLLVWTVFATYTSVAATRVSGAVLAVFVLLALTFLALTIGWLSESPLQFAANSNVRIHIGGWLGLATALAAWYTSFAGVVNFTFKRVVMPTFPRA
jgi:uncharacterized protein